MKKNGLILSLLLITTVIMGQKKELKISYGPHAYMWKVHNEDWDNDDLEKSSIPGALLVDYLVYTNRWLKMGTNMMFDYAEHESYSLPDHFGCEFPHSFKGYEAKQWIFMVGPVCDFEYLHHPKFRMYSGINIAFTSQSNTYKKEGELVFDDLDYGLNFHVNLLGVTIGKDYGLSTELGFGYKGLLNFGFFRRF
ncbi:hypothetical protein DMA11_10965 [Marinilabiliaceae bacterium JC017]|nr:hypothetical protein DMA11_10965 [Marinilabiliaceae bacterium JC017]